MGRPVFISSFNVIAPNINGPQEFERFLLKNGFDKGLTEITNSGNSRNIEFDEKRKSYPKKAELKSMRKDVLASVVCVSELMEKSGLDPLSYINIPFFISSGCFMSEIAEIVETMKEYYSSEPASPAEQENPLNIYEMIPPLTSLRTLTNAIESFSSLNTGLAGDNTTFGSTSASGFYALKEGWQRIANGHAEIAVVGGADIGEKYSGLMFKNFTEESDDWRNSPCSAFFILESENSLQERGLKPLAEIRELSQAFNTPHLFENEKTPSYTSFHKQGKLNGHCIFGGGLTRDNYIREKAAIDNVKIEPASLYPLLGSLGSASLLMSVAASICLYKITSLEKSIVLEMDPYQREFFIELAYPHIVQQ